MVNLNASTLQLPLDSNPEAEFHYVWLRDNCNCNECCHSDTKERILVSADIPLDIAASSASLDEQKLKVRWNQSNHVSVYDLSWLSQHDYSQGSFTDDPATSGFMPRVWGREFESSIPTFQYRELYQSDAALRAWCESIRDYGLTIIRGAPSNEGEIERFAEHVGCVRETIYDRLHNVRATPGEYNAYNVASTTLELKPHTDMPNYNNPPGVQMFHFLQNDSVGGESTAVDGAMVVRQLQEQDPDAFKILSSTPVRFRMFSDRGDIINSNPLLTLDVNGNLKVFRFSNQLAQPANIAPEQMDAFYRAYRKLGTLVEAPENKVQFRLNTGDIMATNNLRVMHGRNAYDADSGGRHLQLSYMDYDDVLSRLRMLMKK